MNAIILAVISNICFGFATIGFTYFTRKISSQWMNFFKALVATIAFTCVCLLFRLWIPVTTQSVYLLLCSGFCGLFIGDIFLLNAFKHLGPGRVLMIYGFQPLMLGWAAHILFGQDFSILKLTAIIFLLLCLFTFSFESFKTKGHWDFIGLTQALIGISLDAVGILMTRQAFEANPEMSPFLANWYRGLGATAAFSFWALFQPQLRLHTEWFKLNIKDKQKLFATALAGTFLSLSFYLLAVKEGHLASISAIAGTTPLFASLFDFLRGNSKPNRYFWAGLSFFIIGFGILIIK